MKKKRTKHWQPPPTKNSWHAMMRRCYDPKCNGYERYGAKGVEVCERWKTFKNFLEDMGERPTGKTLDRIDNTKGYEPGNCRWATADEQQSNRRPNPSRKGRALNGLKLRAADGRELTVLQWARELGMSRDGIYGRLKRGWTIEECLRSPNRGQRKKSFGCTLHEAREEKK